jgi:hypothetical protein
MWLVPLIKPKPWSSWPQVTDCLAHVQIERKRKYQSKIRPALLARHLIVVEPLELARRVKRLKC